MIKQLWNRLFPRKEEVRPYIDPWKIWRFYQDSIPPVCEHCGKDKNLFHHGLGICAPRTSYECKYGGDSPCVVKVGKSSVGFCFRYSTPVVHTVSTLYKLKDLRSLKLWESGNEVTVELKVNENDDALFSFTDRSDAVEMFQAIAHFMDPSRPWKRRAK